jgi:hypothetical protein
MGDWLLVNGERRVTFAADAQAVLPAKAGIHGLSWCARIALIVRNSLEPPTRTRIAISLEKSKIAAIKLRKIFIHRHDLPLFTKPLSWAEP